MHAVLSRTDVSIASVDHAGWQYESHLLPLLRDNATLQLENERLRAMNASLADSAAVWIRLYESALARARRAESRMADLGGR
jgi:hypothetical protein